MSYLLQTEMEFYPAALEIQKTPPLPLSRYILRVIVLFFFLAIVWASIGMVDIVGIAQGKIIPSGQVKIIQSQDIGTVRQIFVKEGDHVEREQALIELDPTINEADKIRIVGQYNGLILEKSRIIAVLEGIKNMDGREDNSRHSEIKPADIDTYLPGANTLGSGIPPEKLQITEYRIQTQLKEFFARTAAMDNERIQQQAERSAVIQKIRQLDATIPLIAERANAVEKLVHKSMAPRMQWLEIEQERIKQVSERDVQRNNLAAIEAGIAGILQRKITSTAEYESALLEQLAATENQIAAIDQEIVKAGKRVTMNTLTAPVAGIIQQLNVHTIGAVVTPARELMHIIPLDDDLVVEAWLPNKDIGFVHQGQAVEIKVATFPFTRYGTIAGEIDIMSNDAVANEKLGLVYAMRVKLYKTSIKTDNKIANLTPGMAVTVEIKLGQRRLIEYFLSPLLKFKDESARER